MRTVLVLLLLLVAVPANAARLVSDNATETVDSCVFDGVALPCSLNAHGGIDVNIDSLMSSPGAYTVKARYCVQGGLWCSAWTDPLAFTVPSAPSRRAVRLSK